MNIVDDGFITLSYEALTSGRLAVHSWPDDTYFCPYPADVLGINSCGTCTLLVSKFEDPPRCESIDPLKVHLVNGRRGIRRRAMHSTRPYGFPHIQALIVRQLR